MGKQKRKHTQPDGVARTAGNGTGATDHWSVLALEVLGPHTLSVTLCSLHPSITRPRAAEAIARCCGVTTQDVVAVGETISLDTRAEGATVGGHHHRVRKRDEAGGGGYGRGAHEWAREREERPGGSCGWRG